MSKTSYTQAVYHVFVGVRNTLCTPRVLENEHASLPEKTGSPVCQLANNAKVVLTTYSCCGQN